MYSWRGEALLVLGAAGGAGIAAVGVGKALGALVLACASSSGKLAVCNRHGADRLFNYSTRGWQREVMNYTNGTGVGCAFDPVGGDYIYSCLRCIGTGGSLLTIGYASGIIPSISLEHLLQRNMSIIGVWTYAVHYPVENEHSATEIVRLWQHGFLRPEVDLVLPMD